MEILANYFKGRNVDQEFLALATEHLTACEVCLRQYASFDKLVTRILPNLIAFNKETLSCEEYTMLLPAYCDKNLEKLAMDRVEQHLRSCERCLEEYDKLLSMRIEEEVGKLDPDAFNLKDFISDEEWERKGQELEERLERYTHEKRLAARIFVTEEEEPTEQHLKAFLLAGVLTAWYRAITRRPIRRRSEDRPGRRLRLKPIQVDDFTIYMTITKLLSEPQADIALNIKKEGAEENRYNVFLISKEGEIKIEKTGLTGNVIFRDVKWVPCEIRFSGAPHFTLNLSFLSGEKVAQFLQSLPE
jgi:hypothetical protein